MSVILENDLDGISFSKLPPVIIIYISSYKLTVMMEEDISTSPSDDRLH
jgi:hypothetical protein